MKFNLSGFIVICAGGFLLLLAIVPSNLFADDIYDGRVIIAVIGLAFMLIGVVICFVEDFWS